MPAASADGERILVVGNAFLGDTVLAIPFLRNLRRRFPRAVIDVLVEPHAAAMLADCPYHDALVGWPRPPRSRRFMPSAIAKIHAQARWLRSRGYDRAYLLKRSFSSGVLAWLAGIPQRVGHVTDGRGWLLSRGIPLRPGRHQTESYLDLLRADGGDVDDGHNENWVPAAAAAVAEAALTDAPDGQPRVFLAVCSTNSEKHWPAARWTELVDRLVRDRGCEVFFCGGPADREMHGQIVAGLDAPIAEHVHDHSSRVPLRQVTALLSRMDLCIGIDSGLPHVAASLGVPVAVLFGPTDPNQWHPRSERAVVVRSERVLPSRAALRRGQPPEQTRWPLGTATMLDIGVADVMAACERLLGPRHPSAPLRTIDLRVGGHVHEVWTGRIAAGASPTHVRPAADREDGRFQPAVMTP
jgi:heptosyltransferase-2